MYANRAYARGLRCLIDGLSDRYTVLLTRQEEASGERSHRSKEAVSVMKGGRTWIVSTPPTSIAGSQTQADLNDEQ